MWCWYTPNIGDERKNKIMIIDSLFMTELHFINRIDTERFWIGRFMGRSMPKDVRYGFDIDGMVDVCERIVVRDGVKVMVWDVPDDLEEFFDLVRLFAYPGVDEDDTTNSGEGEFKALYHTIYECDDDCNILDELVIKHTGSLRYIIDSAERIIEREGKDFAYSRLAEGVTDEGGNPVCGYRWFIDDKEMNSLNGIATDNEVRFVAYQGGKPVVLHRYPMPVHPDAVKGFLDRVCQVITRVFPQYVELVRVSY